MEGSVLAEAEEIGKAHDVIGMRMGQYKMLYVSEAG
jgi:hypothetical protein